MITQEQALSNIALWWHMHEIQNEMTDNPPFLDDQVVMNFMGSGGSHRVTVADLRAAFPRKK